MRSRGQGMFWNNFRARLRYEFDNTMAAGAIALIGWLGFASIVIILAAGAVIVAFSIRPDGATTMNFMEASWASLMRTLDAGTMGGDQGWSYRIVMLIVTLAGIFIVSALIGVMSSGLENKLSELRKGRSKVIEKDHTIIFNWSNSIFDVISELLIANESKIKPRIVIMSDLDKTDMEEKISSKIKDFKNSKIICRTGDCADIFDIELVSPETSRSIIVMSPDCDDADSQVIKTILALTGNPKRRKAPYQIAAELRHADGAELARVVGGAEVQVVLADDLIARIMVQSIRQPGLSAVFTELLDFDGCEIYVTKQPELAGKTFAEAAMSYDTSSLIGICNAEGVVTLNPSRDVTIDGDMNLILISEDDSSIELSSKILTGNVEIPDNPIIEPPIAEKTLILGWNRRGRTVITELARNVGPGSHLTIACDVPDIEHAVGLIELPNENLKIEIRKLDIASHVDLTLLDPLSYDHVLILACSDNISPQAADTRTLVSLLHLRRMKEKLGGSVSIVSEMSDVRNRYLVKVTDVDDFVVSNKIVSLMLSQASENQYLEAIFKDLLDDEGSKICMRPAQNYSSLGKKSRFGDIVQVALGRREIAIGHKLQNNNNTAAQGSNGICINPRKSDLVTYQEGDKIIILAV